MEVFADEMCITFLGSFISQSLPLNSFSEIKNSSILFTDDMQMYSLHENIPLQDAGFIKE